MELRELRITRLPGIDEAFTIEGQPGLNLVIGPNGVGKSSLSRAVHGLLWPDSATVGQIVAATWEIDGRPWFAERAGGPAVSWQLDGQVSEAPRLVSAHRSGIYRLGVLDLLKSAADRTDDELAAEIRRQLAGGIDLAATRQRFERTGKEGQGKAQALAETRRRIRELLAQQQQLADQERRLGELEKQRAGAVAAGDRRNALVIGRDLAGALADLQAAADVLSGFPPVMARLLGNEDQRLADLVTDRDRAAEEVAVAERACGDAERDRDAADLADGGPDDGTLGTLDEEITDLRNLTSDLHDAEVDVATAAATLEHAHTQLGPIEPPPPGEAVTSEAAAAAIARLRERDQERAVRDGLDLLLARDDLGREGTSAAEPTTLEAARKALASWLASTAPPESWPLRWLPWFIMAGLMVVGTALRPWQTAAWPGWFALGLAGTLAPVWFLLRRRAHRDRACRRREARAAYAATEISEPEAWARRNVETTLRGLLAQEAAAVQARLREQLRVALQSERARAATRLGDDDPDLDLDQAQLLQRVSAWHAATAAHAAAEKRREQLAARLEARRTGLVDRLAPWWRGNATEPAVLGSAVADLGRRRDRHREAVKRLENASAQRDAALERRDAASVQITALFGSLDLSEDGADAVLGNLLKRHDDYRQARDEVERLTRDRDRHHRACDELGEALGQVARAALDLSAAERDAAIEDAAAQASRADDLLREITEIRTRLHEARGDDQLDEAQATEESLASDLIAIRDDVRGNALANLLLDRAAARYEAATEPPLLRRTQEFFGRFTADRYGLTVIESDTLARFRAQDRATGRGLALAELSDGTRAQLLLAARLAALPEHERGVQPPLFMDESLTAADALRFAAVGKAILDLVRHDGRQVFYLTCDTADITAWQQLLAEAGEDPAPVIDLAAIRGRAAGAKVARLRPPRPVAVPVPGDDAAAYGRQIQAPPLTRGQTTHGAHLFHLLRDDLPLLHELLQRRVATFGELTALADELLADGVVDATTLAGIHARSRGLTAFLDAFFTGRGRPIPRGALLHESGIKSTKLAEVAALADDLGGDASRLMSALSEKPAQRIKGVRDATRARIEEWLTVEGYLDSRPTLERLKVRERTLRALRSDLAGGNVDWEALDLLVDAWWTAAGGEG